MNWVHVYRFLQYIFVKLQKPVMYEYVRVCTSTWILIRANIKFNYLLKIDPLMIGTDKFYYLFYVSTGNLDVNGKLIKENESISIEKY